MLDPVMEVHAIQKIVGAIVTTAIAPRSRIFVMTIGYAGSGKHTLVQNHPALHSFFRVESNVIHELLHEALPELRDGYSAEGKAYWERQRLTGIIREQVLERVFREGFAVVSLSCNLKRDERSVRIALARLYRYKVVGIWVQCDEDVLLQRLRERDHPSAAKTSFPHRVVADSLHLYNKIQRPRFEKPLPHEFDHLISFRSGKDNPIQLVVE